MFPMSKPRLFRTPHLFDTPEEAIEFFEANRVEGVESLPSEVRDFLCWLPEYEPDLKFNVQPGFKTHYVTCAVPGERYAWLYAKPSGVTFQTGDPRNVEAVLDMWGRPHAFAPEGPGPALPEVPVDHVRSPLATDIWFAPSEVWPMSPAVEFCLRLSAAWAPGTKF
jgi:hypothetical protein